MNELRIALAFTIIFNFSQIALAEQKVGKMTTGEFSTLKGRDFLDYKKAEVFVPSNKLLFSFVSSVVEKEKDRILLTGEIYNSSEKDEQIIYYGNPFQIQIIPSKGVTLKSIPSGGNPLFPSAPTPLQIATIPANSRVRVYAYISLASFTYTDDAKVQIRWVFKYWNKQAAEGTATIRLP